MNLKEAITKYLEGQAKKDPCFSAKYDASKLDACVSSIVDKARKELKGANGCVQDAVVYKWARDFFNDADKAAVTPSAEAGEAAEEKTEPVAKPAFSDPMQTSLFGEA